MRWALILGQKSFKFWALILGTEESSIGLALCGHKNDISMSFEFRCTFRLHKKNRKYKLYDGKRDNK